MPDALLSIADVSKQYRGAVWGLRHFNLELQPGVLGLIGPNGAGKSTLMRILATVTRPSSGQITWNGNDIVRFPEKVRVVLGYLPQDFGIYPNLNPVEFLSYLAAARGMSGRDTRRRIDRLLEIVNLVSARKRRLGTFSGGMKQRVGIAQALLSDPELLIVDEPTAGLDPEERVRFRHLLSELSGDRIVILSSHIVSDVEATATSVAVIHDGHLVAYDSPEGILRAVADKVWEMTVPSEVIPELRRNCIISNTTATTEGIRVRVVAESVPHESAHAVQPVLEDAYLFLLARDRTEKAA
jgi:ABC-2 type transport system ATP-binding protein